MVMRLSKKMGLKILFMKDWAAGNERKGGQYISDQFDDTSVVDMSESVAKLCLHSICATDSFWTHNPLYVKSHTVIILTHIAIWSMISGNDHFGMTIFIFTEEMIYRLQVKQQQWTFIHINKPEPVRSYTRFSASFPLLCSWWKTTPTCFLSRISRLLRWRGETCHRHIPAGLRVPRQHVLFCMRGQVCRGIQRKVGSRKSWSLIKVGNINGNWTQLPIWWSSGQTN